MCGVGIQDVQAVLRVRYDIGKHHGEAAVDVDETGNLERDFWIGMPSEPFVLITKVYFGHANNVNRQYDVTARLQARVDSKQCQGRLLHIPRTENLISSFGDPCYGVKKSLSISYEVHGWFGELRIQEAHGRLLDPVRISAPTVQPQLNIVEATWGVLDPSKGKNSDRPQWVSDNWKTLRDVVSSKHFLFDICVNVNIYFRRSCVFVLVMSQGMWA